MAREIPLSQGKVALVDDADYEWLSQWRWHYSLSDGKLGYAARHTRKNEHGYRPHRNIRMHNLIMGSNPGYVVDHRNRDTLDNRRENLRWATVLDNLRNRTPRATRLSQYKGVQRYKHGWTARIVINQKNIHLGVFKSEADAARAYDKAARTHFGEFAATNFEVSE